MASNKIEMSLDDIIKTKRGGKSRQPQAAARRNETGARRTAARRGRATAMAARRGARGGANVPTARLVNTLVKKALLQQQLNRRQQRPRLAVGRRINIRGRTVARGTNRRGRGRASLATNVKSRLGLRRSTGGGVSDLRQRLGFQRKQARSQLVNQRRGLDLELGRKTKGRGNIGMMASDVEAQERQQRVRLSRTVRGRGRGAQSASARLGRVQIQRQQQPQLFTRRGRGRRAGGLQGALRSDQYGQIVSPKQRLGAGARRGRINQQTFIEVPQRGGRGRGRGGFRGGRVDFANHGTGRTLNDRFGGGGSSRVKVQGQGRRQFYF